MGIPVYAPRVEVKLIKLVKRRDGVASRYSEAKREFDLTGFLGDGGQVRVSKSLGGGPGAFSVSFADQYAASFQDSFYAMVEPMDVIEIRGARQAEKYAGRTLPLLMRGFVSQVHRSEAMSPEGEPNRAVTITGQDAGKLWMIHRLLMPAVYYGGADPFLDLFRFQAATGMDSAYMPVAQAMRQLTERVINPKVEQLAAYSERTLRPFAVEATVAQGTISPTVIAPFQGPFWQLAELMADRPWNEVFVEDMGEPGQEVPTLRFRPAPYKTIAGELIMPGATDPGTVELDAAAVVQLDLNRTDGRIANFFLVPPGASLLDSQQLVTISMIMEGVPADFSYANNKPELYGTRVMQVTTSLLPGGIPQPLNQLAEGQRGPAATTIVEWHRLRIAQLRAMNRDNGVFEEGSAVVRGSEELKPGRYLRLKRGELVFEGYMDQVAHAIGPLQGWTTTVQLERVTSFLERNKMTQPPYLAEGFRGPYDR